MRDLGQCRNAEYYFAADPDSVVDANKDANYTKLRESLYSSAGFSKQLGPDERNGNPVSKVIGFPNKTVYGYGGPTSIAHVYNRVGASEFGKTAGYGGGATENVDIVRRDNVRLNDYTKNISQSIFSP